MNVRNLVIFKDCSSRKISRKLEMGIMFKRNCFYDEQKCKHHMKLAVETMALCDDDIP